MDDRPHIFTSVKPLENLLHIAPVTRTFSEILNFKIWTMI